MADVVVVETLTPPGPVVVEPAVPALVSVEFVQTVIDVEVVLSGVSTDSSIGTSITDAIAALAVL